MQQIWQDVRFGLRKFLKTPGSTLVIILTLALGIGANATIFSVVNGVLLRPLPYADSHEIIRIRQYAPLARVEHMRFSVKEVMDYREQNQTLEQFVEYHTMSFALLGGDEPLRVQTGVVSAEFFDLLGISPLFGRTFVPEDDSATGDGVIVLTHELWQRLTGGNRDVLGKTYTINDRIVSVIGVLPPLPPYPGRDEAYVPVSSCALRMWSGLIEDRNNRMMAVMARRKEGVSLNQVQADLDAIAARLRKDYPESYSPRDGYEAVAVPALIDLAGNTRQILLILLGTTGFVLLIVCANVANLVLARLAHRERELALRTALGAGRRRLTIQLLTESMLLSLLGGVGGLILAGFGLRALLGYAERFTPRASEVSMDTSVLLFTLAISILTGLGFGIAPALLGRRNLASALREGTRGSAGHDRQRLRGLLLIGQVGISCALLIGAALMVQSLGKLLREDPGFDPDNVLSAIINLPFTRYTNNEERIAFYRPLLERLQNHPGVVAAAVTMTVPMNGKEPKTVEFQVENRPVPEESSKPVVDRRAVTPEYFRLLDIPLVKGRLFDNRDVLGSNPVVIVNQSTVSRFWGDDDPIGDRVSRDGGQTWATVIGVVGDVKNYGLDERALEELYEPFYQVPLGSQILVRSTSAPLQIVPTLRDMVREIDPDQPVARVETLEQFLVDSTGKERLGTLLLSLFAGLALVVTAMGIAALMAFMVSQRTQEIGIRMALGAGARSVLAMIVGQGMVMVGTGLAVGVIGALALNQVLKDQLFGVSSTDPLTYIGVAAILLLVSAMACLVPARRATVVDPLLALRSE